MVDTPEVYTRERLVNDRLTQAQWLRSRLSKTDELTFRVIGSVARSTSHSSDIALASAVGSATASAPPPHASVPPPPSADGDIGVSPVDDFRDRLAYRREVRSALIESELDDRHDMGGNTLYHLKFDTAVIPRANTRAYAVVRAVVSSVFHLTLLDELSKAAEIDQRTFDGVVKQGVGDDDKALQRLRDLYEIYSKWLKQTRTEFQARLQKKREPISRALRLIRAKAKEDGALSPLEGINLPDLKQFQESLGDHVKGLPDATRAKVNRCRRFSERGEVSLAWVDCVLQELSGDRKRSSAYAALLAERSAAWFMQGEGGKLSEPYRKFADVHAEAGTVVVAPRQFAATPKGKEDSWTSKAQKYHLVELAEDRTSDGGQPPADTEQAPKPPKIMVHRNVGFIEFLRALHGSVNRAYTYSVAPRERSQRVLQSDEIADAANLTLGLSAAVEESAATSLLEEARRSARRANAVGRHPLVVGFSHDGLRAEHDRGAHFGWMIGPRLQLSAEAEENLFLHRPVHNSLSVVVSAPSWWTSMRVTIVTYWRGTDGTCYTDCEGSEPENCRVSCARVTELLEQQMDNHVTAGEANGGSAGKVTPAPSAPSSTKPTLERQEFVVRLPGDELSVMNVLMRGEGLKQPAILYEEMEEVHLRAGKPGSLVIPGKQLWRSTMVTLGGQPATRITVLPDMDGIVAYFDQIPWPGPQANGEPKRLSAIVWTSEGRATTRATVVIHPAETK